MAGDAGELFVNAIEEFAGFLALARLVTLVTLPEHAILCRIEYDRLDRGRANVHTDTDVCRTGFHSASQRAHYRPLY